MCTAIGAFVAFFSNRQNTKFLSVALGFSAGVMIYISLAGLFIESKEGLVEIFGRYTGGFLAIGAFFIGIFFLALLDKIISHCHHNPLHHHNHNLYTEEHEHCEECECSSNKLLRMGLVTALTISIHNIPEGFAVYISALKGFSVAIPVALSVALHNIPVGIAVAVPVYYATGSRWKAFLLALLTGMTEILGALLGCFLLGDFMGDALFGVIFAFVAGIMVFISFDELLPVSNEYGEHKLSLYGLFFGIGAMAITSVLVH